MRIRRASDRGVTETSWLKSRHSFSFGDYFDPAFLGYRSLRVINDDWVAPAKGFGMHGHRDMEIITIVLEGELEHQDSLGHKEVLRPGEVQVMSAGTGIRHSEMNPSPSVAAHFVQIWIEPSEKGLAPRYEQRAFPAEASRNSWCRIAGPPHKQDAALLIHQRAQVYRASLVAAAELSLVCRPGVGYWLHVMTGQIAIDAALVGAGDSIMLEEDGARGLLGVAPVTELLLFELQ